jgi:hypothetical protein
LDKNPVKKVASSRWRIHIGNPDIIISLIN